MANRHGFPIWYELMTPEPEAATRFYEAVVGWHVQPPPTAAVDYRMIAAADGTVAGMLLLSAEMQGAGAQPGWLVYMGVEDVDATAAQAKSLGGHVFVPPTNIEDVGRFALLADPQAAPFYIMHPDSPEASRAFARGQHGHCGWNELCCPDPAAALSFYGALFGWENRDTMDMGALGPYHFLSLGDEPVGAVTQMKDRPAHWNLYFVVPDIEAAVAAIHANGGSVLMGPHDVPSGDSILLACDPQKAPFALVARKG